MNILKLTRPWTSPEDSFIEELRTTVPENDSQQKERLKHEKIAKLRDEVQPTGKNSLLWEDF